MSNTPGEDPIGHAAKFLWLFALIPVIFGSMIFFLPRSMRGNATGLSMAFPFVLAALIALVGVGVHRRSITAAWAGIGLFALAIAGMAVGAIVGGPKLRGVLFFVVLFAWPIRKLHAAIGAISAEKARPPVP